MIRYLDHNAIDKKKWDAAIRNAFNGHMYAYSWYLDIVHPEWEALVEDDYVRVMPLTGNRKWGIDYLLQPFFVQQLGVFSTGILNSDIVRAFVQAIPRKFKFVQINLNVHNKLQAGRYCLSPNRNYLLDLIARYPVLYGHYSANTKRNLKKAEKAGLSLSQGLDPHRLTELFRQNKGREITHWGPPHYKRLERIMYRALYMGTGEIYGVYTAQNNLCAGAFFLKDPKYLVFLFSATDAQARQTGAMTLLIDHVIRSNAESAKVLDFEGSNNDNLARFYRGFGSQEITYYRLEINRLPFPVNKMVSVMKHTC